MRKFLLMKQWGWKTSGTALGLIIVLAVVLVKPISVSTQYVIFDGILWNAVSSDIIQKDDNAKNGYRSRNQYLDKNDAKYAKSIAEPVAYGLAFVVSMIVGGFLASSLRSDVKSHGETSVQQLTTQQRFGTTSAKRYMAAFLGGVLVLYGARLAGGCTSGHMMSGMMQTSYSGYVFSAAVFLIAIPTALLLYREDSSSNDERGSS